MVTSVVTVSSKHQIAVPVDTIEALDLHVGDKVVAELDARKRLEHPKRKSVNTGGCRNSSDTDA